MPAKQNLEEQQEQKRRLLHLDAIPQISMKPTNSPAAFSVESDDNNNNGLSDSGASPLLRQRNGVSQTQSQALLQHDDYLSQRADAMQQVETTLTQLQTMFRQVTDMVQLQGEYVERYFLFFPFFFLLSPFFFLSFFHKMKNNK